MTDCASAPLFDSSDARLRLADVEALHLLHPDQQEAVMPDVLRLLSDPEAAVRWSAAALLHAQWARRYPHTAHRGISDALRASEHGVVQGALQRLVRHTQRGQFDDRDECDISAHVPEVCVLLCHPSDAVQQAALLTLSAATRGSHTIDLALPSLVAYLPQAAPDRQAQALSIIKTLKNVDLDEILNSLGGLERIPMVKRPLRVPLIRLALREQRQDVVARMVRTLEPGALTTLLATLEQSWNTPLKAVLSEALAERAASVQCGLQVRMRGLLVGRSTGNPSVLKGVVSSMLDSLHSRASIETQHRVADALAERAIRIMGFMTSRSALSQAARVRRWDLLQPAVPHLQQWLSGADERLCTKSAAILRDLLFDCDPEALAALLPGCSDLAFSVLAADIDFENLNNEALYDALEARSLPVVRQQLQAAAARGATSISRGWKNGPRRPWMVLPPVVASLTQLTTLRLLNQQLRSLPPELGMLQSLWELDISNNPIRRLPDALGDLESLNSFRAQDCALAYLPERLCDLSSLTRLEISSPNLTALPDGIGRLSALVYLSVCGRLQVLPESICQLRSLTSLHVLSPLRTLPKGFSTLAIESLTLTGLDRIPDAILEMEHLVELDLSHGTLTELPSALASLPNLAVLNVTGCGVRAYPDALLERHAAGLTLWPRPRRG